MAFSLFKVIKGLLISEENTLNPKNVQILPGGTAGTTTTIQSSQTTDKTLTLPDATDTLVGKATTDVLTNKSINAANNTITNLNDATIAVGAGIDATKIAAGTVDNTEFGYLDGVTAPIQTQINGLQPGGNYITDLTGDVVASGPGSAVATIQPNAITDAKVSTGISAVKIGTGVVDNTEFSYLDGVTSSIQTQINAKADAATAVTLNGVQTLTNKTLTAPVINSPVGIVKGDVGLGNVDNTSDATKNAAVATLTNKTLVEPIINDVVFTQQVTPANPSVGSNKVYTKNDNKLYVLNSDGTETAVGSGGTGVNFIQNGDAEGLNPFVVTRNTTASARPDSGFISGGTVLTTSISATNPLNGTKSFLITKPASNAQGNQAYIPFTVSPEFRAKAIQITVPYIVNSGTFVAGSSTTDSDMIVYIYDVTNNTFIEPSSFKFLSNSTSISDKIQATFQTSATGSSYRLLLHVASTSALTYELKVDDISVSQQTYQYGTPMADEQLTISNISSTGTSPSKGGVIFDRTTYSRDGQFMYIRYTYRQNSAGSNGTGTYLIPVPNGMSIDTTNLVIGSFVSGTDVGSGKLYNGSILFDGQVVVWNANNLALQIQSATADFAGWGAANGGFGNTIIEVSFTAKVPIQGWSSSVQTSDQTDTRVVATKANKNGTAQSGVSINNSFAKVTWSSVSGQNAYDTSGAFSTTNSRFVAQVPGIYNLNSNVAFQGTNSLMAGYFLSVFKNNALEITRGIDTVPQVAGGGFSVSVTGQIEMVAGDYIEVFVFGRGNNSVNTLTIDGTAALTFFAISRISGPSAIAATETVSVIANRSSILSVPNNTLTPIPYNNIERNTHGAYNPANGRFTVPITGQYRISGAYAITFVTGNAATYYISISVNGSIVREIISTFTNTVSNDYSAQINAELFVNAGSYIEINIYQSSGASRNLNANSYDNYLSITKVGI